MHLYYTHNIIYRGYDSYFTIFLYKKKQSKFKNDLDRKPTVSLNILLYI